MFQTTILVSLDDNSQYGKSNMFETTKQLLYDYPKVNIRVRYVNIYPKAFGGLLTWMILGYPHDLGNLWKRPFLMDISGKGTTSSSSFFSSAPSSNCRPLCQESRVPPQQRDPAKSGGPYKPIN